jgi:aminopeptidase YwaD
MIRTTAMLALAISAATPATAQDITLASVRAHERFLTSAPLRGRGSATPDEAVAAAYVAAQFEAAGLTPVPGLNGYIQTAPVIRLRHARPATAVVNGRAVDGLAVLDTRGGVMRGPLARLATPDAPIARGDVVVYEGPLGQFGRFRRRAMVAGAVAILMPRNAEVEARIKAQGEAGLPIYLDGMPPSPAPTLAALPPATLAALRAGTQVTIEVPVVEERTVTSNAIAYLPGTDPAAKLIMVSAHLDHDGVDANGVVRQGANDNASGTVAVMELARALAAGKRPRRGILFVAYGAEEAGLLGSRWFAEHPPLPLERIAANVEFEMIGAQDPKLPRGALMMTGFERSTLADVMTRNGAHVAPDPYPEQNFFQRSDNYALALKGIVAHTMSGWATVPTYHTPQDTFDAIDLPFMTAAIQSLVKPIRALANGRAEPRWKPGGKPTP